MTFDSGRTGIWRLAALVTAAGAILAVVWAFEPAAPAAAQRSTTIVQLGDPQLPTSSLRADDRSRLGSAEARIRVVYFWHPACRQCSETSASLLQAVRSRYLHGGQVSISLRMLDGPEAAPSIDRLNAAVGCAEDLDLGWALHDAIVESGQPERIETMVATTVARAGGDKAAALNTCVAAGKGAGRLEANRTLARALGVIETPALVVGLESGEGGFRAVRRFDGSVPASELFLLLERVLTVVERRATQS